MIFHFSAKKCLNNPQNPSTRAIYGLYCCLSRIFGVFLWFRSDFLSFFGSSSLIQIQPIFEVLCCDHIEFDFVVFNHRLDFIGSNPLISLILWFSLFEFYFLGFIFVSLIFFFGFIFWLSNFLWHRNPGPVECCHESEKFFLKKVEKSRKNTKKHEKRGSGKKVVF